MWTKTNLSVKLKNINTSLTDVPFFDRSGQPKNANLFGPAPSWQDPQIECLSGKTSIEFVEYFIRGLSLGCLPFILPRRTSFSRQFFFFNAGPWNLRYRVLTTDINFILTQVNINPLLFIIFATHGFWCILSWNRVFAVTNRFLSLLIIFRASLQYNKSGHKNTSPTSIVS